MSPTYEMMCWITKKAPLHELMRKASKTVTHSGGVVHNINPLGSRVLPYSIKKHQEKHEDAQLVFMTFESSPATVKELGRLLHIDERVLRFMPIKLKDRPLKQQDKIEQPRI